ncbi:hypothetical protein V5O48_007455 [Marasmius crinis-equi]|uniref:DNA 3'-5' helicase n=1 Tax=Marasmius crinis-equi TaxID=585013 RepID=A0ABR3FH80_9AGAR
MELLRGRDIFYVIATGRGKTLVFMAPLVAAQARGISAIAFMIVPTKALAEQQTQTATHYGIKTFALTEDTIREAKLEGHDLVKELWSSDGIRLAVMSPQMLGSTNITFYIDRPTFRKRVQWMFVDEVHLFDDQSSTFQIPYRSIAAARLRLDSGTIWAAATGTITEERALAVASELGFQRGHYFYRRYRLDRPNIKYIPRFFEYPYTTTTFLDLSFLIPFGMTALNQIRRTLIFVPTIQIGYSLMRFLERLIPKTIPDRLKAIKLYNSLFSPTYRRQFRDDIEGDTPLRIGIATETLTFGMDLRIYFVVVFNLRPSHENLRQILGRAGRDGMPSVAYTYAPPWVREVPPKAQMTKQETDDKKRREALPQVTREWYNPKPSCCSRAADMKYYGELDNHSVATCRCSIHETASPQELADVEMVERWVEHLKMEVKKIKDVTDESPMPRSDKTYRPLKKARLESFVLLLEQWRNRKWSVIRTRKQRGLPSHYFFPSALLQHLAERAHLCSTLPRLQVVLQKWDKTYLEQYGQNLFDFLKMAMDGYEAIHGAVEDDELDDELDETEEVVVKEEKCGSSGEAEDSGTEPRGREVSAKFKLKFPPARKLTPSPPRSPSKRHPESGSTGLSPRKKRGRTVLILSNKENRA